MNILYTKMKINIVQQQEKDKSQLEILSVESSNSINVRFFYIRYFSHYVIIKFELEFKRNIIEITKNRSDGCELPKIRNGR